MLAGIVFVLLLHLNVAETVVMSPCNWPAASSPLASGALARSRAFSVFTFWTPHPANVPNGLVPAPHVRAIVSPLSLSLVLAPVEDQPSPRRFPARPETTGPHRKNSPCLCQCRARTRRMDVARGVPRRSGQSR